MNNLFGWLILMRILRPGQEGIEALWPILLCSQWSGLFPANPAVCAGTPAQLLCAAPCTPATTQMPTCTGTPLPQTQSTPCCQAPQTSSFCDPTWMMMLLFGSGLFRRQGFPDFYVQPRRHEEHEG